LCLIIKMVNDNNIEEIRLTILMNAHINIYSP